jgi:hypothetical protein
MKLIKDYNDYGSTQEAFKKKFTEYQKANFLKPEVVKQLVEDTKDCRIPQDELLGI